jgi:hypothetical protein
MNPWKMSAQFAAYMWFIKHGGRSPAAAEDARKFAKNNWVAFIPCADKGVGRLLIAIARPSPRSNHRTAPAKHKTPVRRAQGVTVTAHC